MVQKQIIAGINLRCCNKVKSVCGYSSSRYQCLVFDFVCDLVGRRDRLCPKKVMCPPRAVG